METIKSTMQSGYAKAAAGVSIVAVTLMTLVGYASAQTEVEDAITAGADSISDQVVAILPAVIGGSAVLFAAFLGIRALFSLFRRAVS